MKKTGFKYRYILVYLRYNGLYRIFSRNGTYLCDIGKERGRKYFWATHSRITPNQLDDINDFIRGGVK
jgi:hypothetical protein